MEKRYTVRQAVTLTGVKSYVLRYWEDELCLHIARNQRGHRYYTEKDIQVLLAIKELKKKNLQLKEIKEIVPMLYGDVFSKEEEERKAEFYRILEKLMQELQKKSKQEERYKRVDEAIRQHQLARRQVAATQENGKRKKQKS